MQARKRTVRDLVVPIILCSALLLMIATAVWTVADELHADAEGGLLRRIMEFGGDAGSSMSILLVWFLPLSVITAAIVLFRRSRGSNNDDEGAR